MARASGGPRVLVPARPGITNAIGCVTADLRHDYVNTVNSPLTALDIAEARGVIEAQIEEGRQTIARDGVAITGIEFLHFADMQFQGQTHILTVPIAGTSVTVEALQAAFDEAYWARFEVELPEIRAVLVNLHTAVIGRRKGVALSAFAGRAESPRLADAETGERRVWFEGGWRATPLYDRARLPGDAVFGGPAIVNQLDCTTIVEPGNRVTLDRLGNLIIEVGP